MRNYEPGTGYEQEKANRKNCRAGRGERKEEMREEESRKNRCEIKKEDSSCTGLGILYKSHTESRKGGK